MTENILPLGPKVSDDENLVLDILYQCNKALDNIKICTKEPINDLEQAKKIQGQLKRLKKIVDLISSSNVEKEDVTYQP